MIKVDYSQYTQAELHEALQQIPPDSENYPALIAAIDARQEEAERPRQRTEKTLHSAETRVKVIGYIQLLAAFVMTVGLIFGPLTSWQSLISVPFIVLSAAAGYTAISEQVKWYWLSILNQGLQVVSFSFGILNYKYTGLGGIQIGFTWLKEFELSFGILFSSTVRLTGNSDVFSLNALQIDVLALVLMVALLTGRAHQR
ncbi:MULTISPECIES: hypothetical protein [unclassified Pseudoalteromonas]|uniref:hypothetical protein n=1 Tax=unclassified Pseudoalteromonas TaxID=194690 RepID=UPI0020979879|nr:hypothetical protein [Pseudoalteromonas sp. XMcav2-N]MCO7187546.1 hypothetical protein [Pseudoalteromonas sp. XMcav2-N]